MTIVLISITCFFIFSIIIGSAIGTLMKRSNVEEDSTSPATPEKMVKAVKRAFASTHVSVGDTVTVKDCKGKPLRLATVISITSKRGLPMIRFARFDGITGRARPFRVAHTAS